MKTILIPTDFSKCANNAVIVAFEMAKKNKCNLAFYSFFKNTSRVEKT